MYRYKIVLITVIAAVLQAATAQATVTIGSSLSKEPDNIFNCTDDDYQCTVILDNLPIDRMAPGGLAAPSDGVVTHWRIRVGDDFTQPLKLRVVRPEGSQFTGAGTSASVLPALSAISEFSTRLPVKQGDYIGLDCCGGSNYVEMLVNGTDGGTFTIFMPSVVDGQAVAPFSKNSGYELAFNADIEADTDGDGYGDETQDLCPSDPALQTSCPPDDPPKDDPKEDPKPTPKEEPSNGTVKQPPVAVPDTSPPKVSGLRLNGKRFRKPGRAKLSFGLSESSTLTYALWLKQRGRVVKGICRTNRASAVKAATCRQSKLLAQVTRPEPSGSLNKALREIFKGRKLARGTYKVEIVAVDSAGNSSSKALVTFSVTSPSR